MKQRTAWLLVLPMVAWLVFFYLLPLGAVALQSFHLVTPDYEIGREWTLENYRRAMNPDYYPVVLRSAAYAAATTLACLLLGYPLAYYIALHGGRHKSLFLLLLMLPFWTSYLVRTYCWMTLLQTEGLLNTVLFQPWLGRPLDMLATDGSVILGLTYGFLPFATLPIYVALERIDRSLLEASADLGGSPTSTFLKVVLPLSRPGVIAATLLTFVPAMGDFVTPELLGGPSTITIGQAIQEQYLQLFDWPFGAALALLLMVLMLIGIALYLRLSGSERVLA